MQDQGPGPAAALERARSSRYVTTGVYDPRENGWWATPPSRSGGTSTTTLREDE